MNILFKIFSEKSSIEFRLWKLAINFIIVISCIEIAIETDANMAKRFDANLILIEYFAVAIFSIDYLGNAFFSRRGIRYIFSFWGFIDLLAILPTILQVVHMTGFQGIKLMRTLQVAKMVRIFKILHNTVELAKTDLAVTDPIKTNLKIYFTCFFLVVMSTSTLMYYVEGGCYTPDVLNAGQRQIDTIKLLSSSDSNLMTSSEKFIPTDPLTGAEIPEDKRYFTSIPQTAWWSLLAVTGNSEVFPITLGGKVIACITYFLGLILFGILINIVGKSIMKNFFIDPDVNRTFSKQDVIVIMIEQKWITDHEAKVFQELPLDEINLRLKIMAQL